MSTTKQKQSEELRLQGNECVKGGNYGEAIIHYSHAINIEHNNHLLYSNRSLAFLKLQQYYMAMEDAKSVIKLQPTWPKGFYRKGEVEFNVGHFTPAVISYGQALLLDPSSREVREALTKTNKEIGKLRKQTAREPWIFCGGGAVLGLLIVLADQFLAKQPSIQFLLLQLILVLVFMGLGFGALKIYKYIRDSQKRSLLEQPIDLLEEMEGKKESSSKTSSKQEQEPTNSTETHKPHRKGGVGAARQRYKKGKS